MPFRDPQQSLEDILEHVELIQHYMQDVDADHFSRDALKRAAVERWLSTITEAGVRLGDQAALFCPDAPWPQIRVLGKRLRHAYDLIDSERVYNIVVKDLPVLRKTVEAALHGMRPNR